LEDNKCKEERREAYKPPTKYITTTATFTPSPNFICITCGTGKTNITTPETTFTTLPYRNHALRYCWQLIQTGVAESEVEAEIVLDKVI
jgi:hypothetical protein